MGCTESEHDHHKRCQRRDHIRDATQRAFAVWSRRLAVGRHSERVRSLVALRRRCPRSIVVK